MQSNSHQTDTLKTDSIAPALSTDTVLQDTSIARINKDSSFVNEKKDSIIPVAAKKITFKNHPVDSAEHDTATAQPFTTVKDSTDTLQAFEVDSSPDSLSIVPLNNTDTLGAVKVENNAADPFPAHLRNVENHSWVVILFLVIFSILAWVKVSYSKRIRQFFEAILSNRYVRQLVREEFVFSHPSSIVLSVVFLFNATLLLLQANYYFHWNVFIDGNSIEDPNGLLVFIKILFSLVVFYSLKIIAIRMSAFLFGTKEEIIEYLFTLFLFNNVLGIILLPFTLGVFFATIISPLNILFFSGGLASLAFLFRLVKCLYTGSVTTKFPRLYIILYICTLEILPFFVVIKAFSGNN